LLQPEINFFYSNENEGDVMINGMESHKVINVSEDRAAAIYSEAEVLVFPKQLKQLKKIQNAITQKQ
jgi:hypothetical protein